jgi:hypothetical protein
MGITKTTADYAPPGTHQAEEARLEADAG